MSKLIALAVAAVAVLIVAAGGAEAQFGPGGLINPGRDCQTIRQCRFDRGGSFRGCVSTYSCRVCKLVPSSCTVSGREQTCSRFVCTWGG